MWTETSGLLGFAAMIPVLTGLDIGGEVSEHEPDSDAPSEGEHFVPTGTMTILGLFVVTLILLWVSIYLILIARGVTV